jgi:hypothetical protein
LLEHVATPTKSSKDGRGEEEEQQGKRRSGRRTDHRRVQGQRLRAGFVARTQSPADGGGDAAAHGPRREHLHQHDQRKDEGDGGELRGAENADVDRLSDCHQRRHQHRRQVRQRQAKQGRQDRRDQ